MTTAAPVVVAHERASAADRPCALYAVHYPEVSFTEGHHRRPVFLQNRVWGRIRDGELLWVCSNCHDSIHGWLYWLLGERARPTGTVPPRARREAQAAFDWYVGQGGTVKRDG